MSLCLFMLIQRHQSLQVIYGGRTCVLGLKGSGACNGVFLSIAFQRVQDAVHGSQRGKPGCATQSQEAANCELIGRFNICTPCIHLRHKCKFLSRGQGSLAYLRFLWDFSLLGYVDIKDTPLGSIINDGGLASPCSLGWATG